MKQEILGLLKRSSSGFVSGEELSRGLGVSRTAVWKQIKALREEGYKIEAQSRLGYRLQEAPDKLYPAEIRDGLQTELFGQNIIYQQTVTSTNDLAKQLAADGAPEGTVVIAEEQTSGRGRRGRAWISPPGQGVWVSVIFRPGIAPAEATQFTLLSAVAVLKTIRRVAGVNVEIKWPNDLVMGGRKLAGILTEMSAEMDTVNYLVVGIGTNLNTSEGSLPPEVRDKAASLMAVTGKPISRITFLQALLEELECAYRLLRAGKVDEILEEWQSNCITLGREVLVSSPRAGGTGLTVGPNTGDFTGVAIGVRPDGGLLVKKADGETVLVTAGDVSLTNIDGTYC